MRSAGKCGVYCPSAVQSSQPSRIVPSLFADDGEQTVLGPLSRRTGRTASEQHCRPAQLVEIPAACLAAPQMQPHLDARPERRGALHVVGGQFAHVTTGRHTVGPFCCPSDSGRLGAGRCVTQSAQFPKWIPVLPGQSFMRQTEFDEPEFLARLRRGEEQAYRSLIRRFHFSLIGVAATIIGSRAQAEEVVQDGWLAVFAGIDRFEGRSSLVTWVFSIVLNRARTRARREGRLVGLSALLDGTEPGGRAVDLAEFKADGHWLEVPSLWDELSPERIVGGRQLWDHVTQAIERLPAGQRAVIMLRDMEGREAEEACSLLGISAENQRVLLHRARGRIRQTVDALIGGPRAATVSAPTRRRSRSGADALGRLAVWARLRLHGLLPVPV